MLKPSFKSKDNKTTNSNMLLATFGLQPLKKYLPFGKFSDYLKYVL